MKFLGCLAAMLLWATQATAQILPIPNNDTKALFFSLVAGKPFGQATLLALEPTLAQYCIALTPPNAAGDRTKIGDPISMRWTRVGFGEGDWVWIPQGDVYTPNCVVQPPPPPVDLTQRVFALEQEVSTLIQKAAADEVLINNLMAEVNDLTARVGVLESRHIPTTCTARVLGIPISCKLN